MSSHGRKRDGNDWNDWGGYMRTKIRKLDKQFELMTNEDAAQDNSLSTLFKNVVIFVNGYTVPSSDELKKLMKNHGGGFQHYYSKSKCTHIIATNLPDSKIRELKDEKVVHPNWLTDSIKQGKLLSYREYLLYGPGGKYKGTSELKGSMMKFVKTRGVPLKEKEDTDAVQNTREALPSSPTSDFMDIGVLEGRSDQTIDCNSSNESKISNSVNCPGNSSNSYLENISADQTDQYTSVLDQGGQLRSADRKRSSVPKAGDPNFVSEFYSHSRLHYLSTWGAEFREFINNLIQTTELRTSKASPPKATSKRRVIMHIDMDSFFVSVTLRNRPELKGKQVAVCHAGRGTGAGVDPASSSAFGSTSEIASCSYEARSCGVKNGMWLGEARKLCPGLICVSYEFWQYREVSQMLYEILASYTHEIQAVSCDEAFVDVTHYVETERVTPLQLAQTIRDEIQRKTNCPASAGIASNILLSRMCTKVAKPNGQFYLKTEDVGQFIGEQKVKDLPGVGYSLSQKLEALNVVTCMDLQRISLPVLRREFGQKTGEMLYKFCRGQDERQLKIERERKSVSAEINYAIRFEKDYEPEKFIYDLSNEVHRRMKSAGVKGKQLTFKLRVRQKDAPVNPTKFMGCGRCDNISRSLTMASFTDDPNIIAKECVGMLKHLGVPVSDIRGMGIQMGKLSGHIRNASSSSSSKSIHDFMRPSTKPNVDCTSNPDDVSDVSTNAFINKGNHTAKSRELTTMPVPLPTVTNQCANFLVASEPFTNHYDDEFPNEESLTDVDDIQAKGLPSSTHMSKVRSETMNRLTDEASTEESKAIRSPEKSGMEAEVMEDMDDFSLVLSENELEEPALDINQRRTKGPEKLTRTISQCSAKQDNVKPCLNRNTGTKTDFPPLPVFPVFSPPRSSSLNPSASPVRPQNRSPARNEKGSPARPNKVGKRSPGSASKKSPSHKDKRPSRRSPGRSTSQRSLHGVFQSAKDVSIAISLSLPSPSQIDRAVFEALPEEIQKDIESSYQQRNQRLILRSEEGAGNVPQSNQLKLPPPSEWDPEVVNCLPLEITEHLRDEFKKAEKKELRGQSSMQPGPHSSHEFSRHENQSLDRQTRHERQRLDKNEIGRTKKSRPKTRTITSFTSAKAVPKANPDISSKQELSAIPQFDASVLEALPESLRHEVQLAYEQQRRHDEREKRKEENSVITHNTLSQALAFDKPSFNNSSSTATSFIPKVSLAGADTLPEIRQMLKLWAESTEVPLDEDVSILVEYLGNLINEKDLEKMWLVLKFYRRLVTDRESWHHAFNSALNSIQRMLKENYGGQLPLKYFMTA